MISKQSGQLTLIIFLGAGLRIFQLGEQSLWFDEAISYLAATLSLDEILNNTVQSSHPPLYYLFLHIWQQLVPDTDAAMRALSVLWGLLLIPVCYLLANALFPQGHVGIVSALLVAVSPFQVLYSQELRMYTQVMVFVTLGIYMYWQGRQGGRLWWVSCVVCFLLAAYTHTFTLLALMALTLHTLIYQKQNKRAVWFLVALSLLTLIILLPWFYGLLTESQKSLGSLRPLTQASARSIVKPLGSLNLLLFGQSVGLWQSAITLFLTLALPILLIIEGYKHRNATNVENLVLLGLLLLSIFGIPLTLYLIRPFFLPDRALSIASPVLLILLAWGTARRQSPLSFLVYGGLLVMLVSSILYLTLIPEKPPYREVITFITQNHQPNDLILHTSDGSYLPALRYETLPNHSVLAHDPDPRKPPHVYEKLGGQLITLEDLPQTGERLWLVVALEHSIPWQQAQSQKLQAQFTLLEQHNFGGIQVYLYNLQR